jgi:hypothetical protein
MTPQQQEQQQGVFNTTTRRYHDTNIEYVVPSNITCASITLLALVQLASDYSKRNAKYI